MIYSILKIWAFIATGILMTGYSQGIIKHPTLKSFVLNSALKWKRGNRKRLERFILEHGNQSAAYNPQNKPVAVFDWDNTVIKNDIGDATFFYLLKNNKIKQPPRKDWGLTSKYLTTAAKNILAHLSAKIEPGETLPTNKYILLQDEILSIYYYGTTTDGSDAFSGFNHEIMDPSYAWASALMAGYTPEEIRGFAIAALNENLARDVGETITLGSFKNLPGFIRYYEQMVDLISAMQENGFDIWALSASSQYLVEALAGRIGISADRVIGVRPTLDDGGWVTCDLKGCGPFKDGDNEMITYMKGKRCWMNSVIFGDDSAAALQQNPDLSKRPLFAAGDSDTDLFYLIDATGLKLVINRNKSRLMSHAHKNTGDNWLINPMFIEPKPEAFDKYSCDIDACYNETGEKKPPDVD